jgi:hypothetical protein
MASISSAPFQSLSVQLGVWTNWAQGPVYGATLTLDRATGNLLIAFVAFFVAYVGTRLWRIICLTLHFTGSSNSAADAFQHQRQVILRNSASSEAGIWSFGELLWAWRFLAKPKRLFAVILPAALLAVVCSAGFIVASGFSSQVSSSVTNEVLLKGNQCGTLDMSASNLIPGALPVLMKWITFTAQTWMSAISYAQECYKSNSVGIMQCSTFPQKSLPFTVTRNAACPFQAGFCRSNNTSILLDTGYLDSNDHFGVNGPPDQRVKFRNTLHCAPIVTEGYKAKVVINNTELMSYNYGVTPVNPNYTYDYPMKNSLNFNTTSPDYTIRLASLCSILFLASFFLTNSDTF